MNESVSVSSPSRHDFVAHTSCSVTHRPAKAMRFAVVTHTSSETNRALASARVPGIGGFIATPRAALVALEPGDVALGRLDVRRSLDGMEDGAVELNRMDAEGVRVLNPPSALLAAHDKLLTARLLRLAGLPHPRTAVLGAAQLDFPLVLKPRFGSWGRDVCLCRDEDELERVLAGLRGRKWLRGAGALVQELVPPRGHDLRVIVAGGRAIGAARRTVAPGEWRTNVALGGRSSAVIPPLEACSLAEEAAAVAGVDLVGVDLLPDGAGGWTLAELNGAVDFRPRYSLVTDVYQEAVAALLVGAPRGRSREPARTAERDATRP